MPVCPCRQAETKKGKKKKHVSVAGKWVPDKDVEECHGAWITPSPCCDHVSPV